MNKQELKQLIKEELSKYVGGLFQSKEGDYISIGIEGSRYRHFGKVVKILDDKKVKDDNGNIFYPVGRLYRGGSTIFQKQYNNKNVVSAKIITQQEFDNQHKQIKVNFIRQFDYNRVDIATIEAMIDLLPVKQASTLNTSRFKDK
jgi:hypothetical protein